MESISVFYAHDFFTSPANFLINDITPSFINPRKKKGKKEKKEKRKKAEDIILIYKI